MNDKKEVIAEIQRQIKFVEQVGSNLRKPLIDLTNDLAKLSIAPVV
jgi:hypothetical protein